jgi:hypothetical protein
MSGYPSVVPMVMPSTTVTFTATNAACATWVIEVPLWVSAWHRACARRQGIKTFRGLVDRRVSCHGCGRTIAVRQPKSAAS